MRSTPTSRTMAITALAVGVGLLTAACGDDAEALSKPDFVAHANAICQKSNDRINAIFDTLLEDQEAAIAEFAGLMKAAAGGDDAALDALESSHEDPFDDINRRAREYGLTVCGEEGA